MRILANYFFRGLLFVFPLFATLYILILLINGVNRIFTRLLFNWLPIEIPGLGLVTALLLVTLLGFLVTRVVTRPIFNYFEQLLTRAPLINIIYTSLKDLTEAFIGERRKFNKPVLVTLADGVDRIGFVTDGRLEGLGIENRITVYCPHSYNFSGNLFLVDPSRVRPLDINPAEAMKFAVSAGITHISLNEI